MLSRKNTLEIEVTEKNIADAKLKQYKQTVHDLYKAQKECPVANALLDLGINEEDVWVGPRYVYLNYSTPVIKLPIDASRKLIKFIDKFDRKGIAKPTKFVLKF